MTRKTAVNQSLGRPPNDGEAVAVKHFAEVELSIALIPIELEDQEYVLVRGQACQGCRFCPLVELNEPRRGES